MTSTIDEAGRRIAVEEIRVPENVRSLDDAHVQALAGSIALQGMLVPVVVRDDGDGFELVAGFHRIAARSLGLADVPVVVRDVETEDADRAVENITRKQLNPYEEAKAVRAMPDRGLTEDGAAQALGWPKAQVTARVKVLAHRDEARLRCGCFGGKGSLGVRSSLIRNAALVALAAAVAVLPSASLIDAGAEVPAPVALALALATTWLLTRRSPQASPVAPEALTDSSPRNPRPLLFVAPRCEPCRRIRDEIPVWRARLRGKLDLVLVTQGEPEAAALFAAHGVYGTPSAVIVDATTGRPVGSRSAPRRLPSW